MSELDDSDPPYFFRRVWTGVGTELDEVLVFKRLDDGTLSVQTDVPRADLPPELRAQAVETIPLAPDGLVIYGRGVTPRTQHDRDHVKTLAERGLIFSECFSVVCVEGELGSHPLAALTEIGREEFESAKARGWA